MTSQQTSMKSKVEVRKPLDFPKLMISECGYIVLTERILLEGVFGTCLVAPHEKPHCVGMHGKFGDLDFIDFRGSLTLTQD